MYEEFRLFSAETCIFCLGSLLSHASLTFVLQYWTLVEGNTGNLSLPAPYTSSIAFFLPFSLWWTSGFSRKPGNGHHRAFLTVRAKLFDSGPGLNFLFHRCRPVPVPFPQQQLQPSQGFLVGGVQKAIAATYETPWAGRAGESGAEIPLPEVS